MKTYLLRLAYDGTDFHGWQRQNGIRTVQQELEDALKELVGEPVTVTASGRTDEGVHALGQAVSFCCGTNIPASKFAAALNGKLPPDLVALDCREVPDDFCARRSAKRKTYVYRIYTGCVNPLYDRYALRVEAPLDLRLLQSAAKLVEGEHDFRSFYCLGSSATTTVRTVYNCSVNFYAGQGIAPDIYEFEICGNGFLYKMVRLIAGALLSLSAGKITSDEFGAALGGQPIKKVPAPSRGLTLKSVEYGFSDKA